METSIKWATVGLTLIAMFYFCMLSEKNNLISQNYEKCLTAMQQAIPDPNDDSRASLLQECQN